MFCQWAVGDVSPFFEVIFDNISVIQKKCFHIEKLPKIFCLFQIQMKLVTSFFYSIVYFNPKKQIEQVLRG